MCTEFLKPHFLNLRFESSVISYGDKTAQNPLCQLQAFESSVISYGDKTRWPFKIVVIEFESSVISYGDKTIISYKFDFVSLRVV